MGRNSEPIDRLAIPIVALGAKEAFRTEAGYEFKNCGGTCAKRLWISPIFGHLFSKTAAVKIRLRSHALPKGWKGLRRTVYPASGPFYHFNILFTAPV
jgi:hypothetical protein